MIVGLAHACFYVADLGRALRFYGEQLGLETAFDYRDDAGRLQGVFLHLGRGTYLEIFERPVAARAGGQSFRHVCLEVDDLASTVAELRARGVETTEITRGRDLSHKAWITDPDGNQIELHQYTDESAQRRWTPRADASPAMVP